MNNQSKLPPYPSGWFATAFSKELKKGKVLRRTFMGQEIIVFRGNNGKATALDAYCPHLGAHLGYGSTVVDNSVQCPFHALKFNSDGECLNAKHLKTKSWHLQETNGLIFLYHGDLKKIHELPHLEKEEWKPAHTFSITLKSHPQEMAENFIDVNHFSSIHYIPHILLNTSFDGVILSTEYSQQIHPFFRNLLNIRVSSQVFGLGISFSQVHIPFIGTKIGFLSSACPINETFLTSRTLFLTQKIQNQSILQKPLTYILSYLVFKTICRFIKQDVFIWNHKKYLSHPSLTSNDGFIYQFRKWAQKFYE